MLGGEAGGQRRDWKAKGLQTLKEVSLGSGGELGANAEISHQGERLSQQSTDT